MVQMNFFVRQKQTTDVENGQMDTEEEGEGGMNWERSIDMNILPWEDS